MRVKILYDEESKKKGMTLYKSIDDIAKEAKTYFGMEISVEVKKTDNQDENMKMPVLFVNGKKEIEGEVPNKKKLKRLIL